MGLCVQRFWRMRNESTDMLKIYEMPLAAATTIQQFLNEMKGSGWCADIICIWWCVQYRKRCCQLNIFLHYYIYCVCEWVLGSGCLFRRRYRRTISFKMWIPLASSLCCHFGSVEEKDCDEEKRRADEKFLPIFVELSIVHFLSDGWSERNGYLV